MMTYVQGDLFDSPAHTIVNAVNTDGVMGKGIAKEFRRRYPDMVAGYQERCKTGELTIGTLWLFKSSNKWILNFPTKRHWREPSQVEFIEAGLQKFAETYSELGISTIAFPALGCGNGGLDFDTQVRPLMERYMKRLPIEVLVHLYSDRK
jgi:O-acetyl-ADP-ribose deacetylase (regulator of RNase III)